MARTWERRRCGHKDASSHFHLDEERLPGEGRHLDLRERNEVGYSRQGCGEVKTLRPPVGNLAGFLGKQVWGERWTEPVGRGQATR